MTVEVPKFIGENVIEEYLPHRGKMLLISRITDYDMDKRIITGEYDITKECIFYEKEGDGIPTWVSFELMAQTVCALTGIAHKLFGRKILPGMILSVTAFKTELEWLKAGKTVRMRMVEDFCDEESALYNYTGELFIVGEDEKPAVTAKISAIEIESLEKLKEIRGRYLE
ncbi:3-hydroxylacyl-ACP dehydratase [bacterium]|jgi:predicted hotdog family 3-hydroxylacyl-ACP dehydratase|nr:3-hydroxylacyl-ACP dehydratase [bacterium]